MLAACREALTEVWGASLVAKHENLTCWQPEGLAWVASVGSGRGSTKGNVSVALGLYLPELEGAVREIAPLKPGEPVGTIMQCTAVTLVLPREDGTRHWECWFEFGAPGSASRQEFIRALQRTARKFVRRFGTRRAFVKSWESPEGLPSPSRCRAAASAAIAWHPGFVIRAEDRFDPAIQRLMAEYSLQSLPLELLVTAPDQAWFPCDGVYFELRR